MQIKLFQHRVYKRKLLQYSHFNREKGLQDSNNKQFKVLESIIIKANIQKGASKKWKKKERN
jgi:hypothetical protein